MQLTILGSGSAGNSLYLETDTTKLLVDAGFSARQLRLRLESIGRDAKDLTGILVTHEHSDHIQGIGVLCSQLSIPVYCNRLTQEVIAAQSKAKIEFRIFTTGATFEVGDVIAETFSVPHDASDPVGYLLRTVKGNVGVLTDLGHATKLVIERARKANVLVLEANHDVRMLQEDTRRPWSLKQRILSRHGHLSNVAAAEAAAEIANADLRHIYLGHLSRDCNRPELAHQVVREHLEKIGAGHVRVENTDQSKPNPTLSM